MSRKQFSATAIRPLVLRALERVNPGDIHIWHPYYPRKVLLHSYHHKGYWFYGKERASDTSAFYARVIQPSDNVVEVGAHIGFQTLHFASLVPQGHVLAFEPGSNNLPYCLHNCAGIPNVEVRREAVGAASGTATFFEDNLTGQNNSLLPLGAELAQSNARSSNFGRLSIVPTTVSVATLDEATGERPVQFIKVNVEGGEADVLAGAVGVLERSRPTLMVNVFTPNQDSVWDLLVAKLGYQPATPSGVPISGPKDLNGHTTFTHPEGPVG
jgi:FkbM family methyltransferase